MPRAAFSHVTTWVFDLDNTLYPPSARLFDQIEKRMASWIVENLRVTEAEAHRLRSTYWADHGTTLAGLMHEHGVEPDPFLDHVHDIDMSALDPAPRLRAAIGALPGRSIVYTNGDARYAARVLAARGLDGLFDAVYGVEHADYRPKPERAAFERVFASDGLDSAAAAMFEDDVRNLEIPHAIGMRTVHVAPEPEDHDHIHHHTDDLESFLSRLI